MRLPARSRGAETSIRFLLASLLAQVNSKPGHNGITLRPAFDLRTMLPASRRSGNLATLWVRSLATQADNILSQWRSLLLYSPPHQDEVSHVKELLHTAIRLRQGKAASTLPEELVGVFVQYYRRLDAGGRERLLRTLSQDFSVQSSEVDQAIVAWQQALQRSQKDRQQQQAAAGRSPVQQEQQAQQQDAPDDQAAEAVSRSAQRLAAASQPLYSRLFLPISQQHCGIKFLVDLRADLQECIRRQPRGSASLRGLSDSLRRVLAEWFSVGLLQLRRLTWEGTPAALLEKVMAYEAVHSMAGWSDLRQRLGPARRVFAFFHQAMPQEPLVVLHTALLRCPPAASMEEIFSGSHDSPDAPTTAVFYSITSTQRGLAGVDLGNFLIKQVAHCLLQEFPSLTTLCTLSPMPGFADWLAMRAARGRQGLDPTPLLLPGELQQLGALAAKHLDTQAGGLEGSPQQAAAVLQWALQGDPWVHNPHLEEALRPAMLRLAAVYLVQEKRRGLALDPVANFHLRNGAELWRLNWRADTSPAFLAQSHGLMANYVYRLEEVAGNNRRYLVDEEVVVGPEVEQLLGEGGGKEV